MKADRLFVHIALAFLLLISQQLGTAHAVSHLAPDGGSSSSQKQQLPAELQCQPCLAFAAIGSALPGSPLSIPQLFLPTGAPIVALHVTPLPTLRRLFDPRGPPILN